MKSTQLTIGTDPELILVNPETDKIIRAADVIEEENEHKDKFGLDGHAYTAELRPNPAIHPRDLVAQVKEALASRAEQLRAFKWQAGPWIQKKPLGGHIHFGVKLEEHIKDALDHQFAILLALSEPPGDAAARRTVVFYGDKPYGLLGDTREKPLYGGFEYRTPSSFIVTPGVALGEITAAKAIVWEEIEGGSQAFSKLSKEDRKALEFTPEDFHACNRQVFLPKLDLLKNQLAKMRYFQKGEEGSDLWPAISYLLKQVIEKGGYETKGDIKAKWKLVSSPKTKQVEPQVFWKDLVEANHSWWLHNPLVTTQEQFVLNAPAPVANSNIPQGNWNWIKADPMTIWTGLGFNTL